MNPFQKYWNTSVDVNVAVTLNKPKEEKKKTPCVDITIIMDKSGSMECLRESVVTGFNKYFKSMKETPGETLWSMVQFDDPASAKGAGEAFPHVVFERRREKDMGLMEMDDFKPRNSTALVDAVCKTIHDIDARCSGVEDQFRQVVMIVTDGQENASREFTSDKMRELISKKQSNGWDFLFLAANQDAWSVAGQYGMANLTNTSHQYAGASISTGAVASGAANSFTFQATGKGMFEAIGSGMVGAMHCASGNVAAFSK